MKEERTISPLMATVASSRPGTEVSAPPVAPRTPSEETILEPPAAERMWPNPGAAFGRLLMTTLDLTSFVGAALVAGLWNRIALIFVAAGWALMAQSIDRRGRFSRRPSDDLGTIVTRVSTATVITGGGAVIMRTGTQPLVLAGLYACAFVFVGRMITFAVIRYMRHRGHDLERVLLIGGGGVGRILAEQLRTRPEAGLIPVGFVGDGPAQRDEDYPRLGPISALPAILEKYRVRHVIIAFGATPDGELAALVRRLLRQPVTVHAIMRFFEFGQPEHVKGRADIGGIPVVTLQPEASSRSSWRAKRMVDFVLASALLVITAPVLLLCALAVKCSSRGPVLFRQQRVGMHGRHFDILKLRTMKINQDSDTTWTVDSDPRVTAVGSVLRPTHLDELPQLINVIRGDMAIVGPRPERPHFVEQFSAEIDHYGSRHRVPAGITGLAQVHGYWGDSSISDRARLDNRYIDDWSLWKDVVILLKTVPTLIGRR